ncbi:serine/threonine-protein kinase [Williamsia sp. MIQD14]|uniref:serine/threonine-protein kinase n=1 Tax=Williamsia sp. MIQD14 TaxID=3425703 RepID=UPI003DA02A41
MTTGAGGAATGPRMIAERYRLGRALGRGAMANVYAAVDETLGRSVAVKLFRVHPRSVDDLRRVEAEMRTLASLSHPGLISLYDAGTTRDVDGFDVPYLVMELVDGPTLGTFRGEHALEPFAVARIGRELADALGYIHAEGVVHRDIKPANILIPTGSFDGRGQCSKLADFGIARVIDADHLTEHGTTVGTVHYMSPEQATGSSATGPPGDIYALGLVLLECLTGRMVFEGTAVVSAMARLHRDPEVPRELGPAWVSLLSDMTSRAPADRPTATSVADRLRAIENGAVPTPTAILMTQEPEPPLVEPEVFSSPSARTGWWMGAAGLALVAAVVGLMLWGTSRPDTTPGEPDRSPAITSVVTASSGTASASAPATSVPTTTSTAPPAAVVPAPPPAGNRNGNGNGDGNAGRGNGNSGGGSGNGNGNNNGNGGNGNGKGNGR